MPPENDEEQPSEDPMIFCFVCGHLRPSKTLIEHIDKCYRRVEAETSLTSIFETKVEGSKRLFCDAYNNNTKAFCKRLKVNTNATQKRPPCDVIEIGIYYRHDLTEEDVSKRHLNVLCTSSTISSLM